MIVVDTNIIAYCWIPGEFTPRAQGVRLQDDQWCSSTLWRSEFRSILLGYVKRRMLTLDQAKMLLQDAEAAGIEEYVPVSEDVLDLSVSSGCSAYDCEFVAIAQALRVPLVTADKEVLKGFPNNAVSMEQFIAH